MSWSRVSNLTKIVRRYPPLKIVNIEMSKKEATLNYKKKMRVHVSKSLNTIKSWDILGPLVTEQITGSEYMPVPYFVDTYAYQIGHIFVEEPLEVTYANIQIKQPYFT